MSKHRNILKLRRHSKGLTILEMIIILAIIATLATVVVLTFSDFILKAHQGFTKGNLGSIRNALKVYLTDTDGNYPTDLDALTLNSRYLGKIPKSRVGPHHAATDAVTFSDDPFDPTDTGGWLYGNVPGSQSFGRIIVNCTHTDTIGNVWTSY